MRYSDQRFRRSAAAFWSSTWPDKNFQRQMRESRKIEELILAFVTSATKSLKKDDDLADGGWKYELNAQIALFLELIYDSLISLGPIPTELGARLDGYRTRLKPDPAPPPSADGQDKSDGVSVMSAASKPAESSKMLEVAAELFGLDNDDVKRSINDFKASATEQAALEDLKVGF